MQGDMSEVTAPKWEKRVDQDFKLDLPRALGRRSFLRNGALGLGALAAGGSGLLRFIGSAAAQEAVRGGVLTLNINTDLPNFDPLSNTSSFVLDVVGACYNSLVMYDPHDPTQVVGDLATSWDISEDGLTYTFHLVDTAKFHDGTPLTSADAKATFDLMYNPPEGTVSVRKGWLSAVKSVEAPDPVTVQFVLTHRQPSLLPLLANGAMLILPKHILDAKGSMKDDVIGSGPYKLKEYISGQSVELERNENYHIKDHPYLDGIIFYLVPDAGTRYAYFSTGQLLMVTDLPGDIANRAKQELADTAVILSGQGTSADSITFNARREPWSDPRVRLAASYAIDRREALKVLIRGEGALGSFMPPGAFALPPEELDKLPGLGPDRAANLEKAKELLAEAGFPDGFKTTMCVRKTQLHQDRGVFVKDQLAQIGIDMAVDIQESAKFFENLASRNFDLISQAAFFQLPVKDPDYAFGGMYTSGPDNLGGVEMKEIDDLFLAQQQATSVEERVKIVHELDKAVAMAAGTVLLYYKNTFVGLNKRVGGYILNPEVDNNVRHQNTWLAP
jgi:peptide/nickel transport system substrate-binding protein